MSANFYQIEIIQPGNIPSRVFDFLNSLEFDHQISNSAVRIGNPDTGDWKMTWLFDTSITPQNFLTAMQHQIAMMPPTDFLGDVLTSLTLDQIHLTTVPDQNWLIASYRGFPPFQVGRFFLYGSHEENPTIPPDSLAIRIDAVTAFGSGEHPTTRGCLVLLDYLASSGYTPKRVLDLGTGSGILAIAACKLWPNAHVVAVDNDPESVRVAAEYAEYNNITTQQHLPGSITCLLADTPNDDTVTTYGLYDLTIANILAGPLRDLAPAIARTMDKKAPLILSGLLETQINEVMEAYTPYEFLMMERHIMNEWAAILLKR